MQNKIQFGEMRRKLFIQDLWLYLVGMVTAFKKRIISEEILAGRLLEIKQFC